ncbi:MAG: hypothetical protein FWC41_05305 [Firmicutes bacterium]|nr:hypothetical protein [Bacillota bacterium]
MENQKLKNNENYQMLLQEAFEIAQSLNCDITNIAEQIVYDVLSKASNDKLIGILLEQLTDDLLIITKFN